MEPKSITLPTPVNFSGEYPTAEKINDPLTAFSFRKYGNLIQTVLNGKMIELLEWNYNKQMRFDLPHFVDVTNS